MDDLHRVRYVTERYVHLQGLRLVPLGIPFLISSLWRDGQLSWMPGTAGLGARIWFFVLLTIALGLSLVAKAYYREQFGDVRPSLEWRTPLAAFLFTGLFIIAASTDTAVQSISVPLLIVALALGYAGTIGGRVRPHYIIIASLVALLAGLGQFGVPFHTREVLCDELLGIGFVVIGVGDHLLLREALGAVGRVESL